MSRKTDRVALFWRGVGGALGLDKAEVRTKRPLVKSLDLLTAHLVGTLGGVGVEAGIHYSVSGDDPMFTYAAVSVSNLPPGFTVGPRLSKPSGRLFGSKGFWIGCGSDGGRELGVPRQRTVRVEVGGLVTEQETEAFDLDTFLTVRRRQVMCSLDSLLHWTGSGGHRLEIQVDGKPYPRRGDVVGASKGDIDATKRVWGRRDAVVDLVQTVVSEAGVVGRELSVDQDGP